MQIVLSILQYLGGFFVGLVLIAIFVVLVIMFYPAKYLVDVHWTDEKWAKFKADWCFHLVRAKVSYGDDLIYGETYVFGKRKTFSYDLTEENELKNTENKEKQIAEISDEGIVSKIKGMIERIKTAYPKLKKIIEDEKNKEAAIHLKDELLYLIKILLPEKSKVDAIYSLGSPDLTGQTFGVLACFPAMYQKNWRILPDFESDDIYLKGIIWGKGRIYGYQIIGIILRIVFDKNCRRLYTIINRFMKWMKKSDNAEVK